MFRDLFICLALVASVMTVPRTNPASLSQKKILLVTITEFSQVFMARDTLMISDLPKELKHRLWKSYLGTGKMHDAVQLGFTGAVTDQVKADATGAVQEGLKMALKDICLEKYKQYFEDLSERQQEKIRKQFPVLFTY